MYFRIKKTITSFFALLVTILVSKTTSVYAAGYIPLEPLTIAAKNGVTLSSYLDTIFKIGIGLAGVFAVLMIVLGGIGYIGGASNPSARNEAKKKITNAILGLILASASWLILYTINPNLLKKEIHISTVKTKDTSVPTLETKTVTKQCYSQSYGSGRSRGTREVCGSTCPDGETCNTQQTEVVIEYCYSQSYRSGRSRGTREVCGSTCPTGETCTVK